MIDIVSPETRSRMMSTIRGRDTKPEMLVRRHLHGLGFRYRLSPRDLPGRPDLVLRRYNVAIFVHGCFWHGHDCARGSRVPKANREYWTAKVARNVARDARAAADLAAAGWRVETIWECDLKDAAALKARLERMLSR